MRLDAQVTSARGEPDEGDRGAPVAGYHGYVEVEIFNADVRAAAADQTAATVRARSAAAFGPGEPGGAGPAG